MKLYREGWFVESDDPKFTATTPEKEMVVVAGKDVRKVSTHFLTLTSRQHLFCPPCAASMPK